MIVARVCAVSMLVCDRAADPMLGVRNITNQIVILETAQFSFAAEINHNNSYPAKRIPIGGFLERLSANASIAALFTPLSALFRFLSASSAVFGRRERNSRPSPVFNHEQMP